MRNKLIEKSFFLLAIVFIGMMIIVYADRTEHSLMRPYYLAGVVSGIFAVAAFGIASYNLYYQRKQFKIQQEAEKLASSKQETHNQKIIAILRKRITLQNEEIERQKNIYNEQLRNEKKSRFEGTFFNLLKRHEEILKGLNYQFPLVSSCIDIDRDFPTHQIITSGIIIKGNEVFEKLYYTYKSAETGCPFHLGLKDYLTRYGIESYHTFEYVGIFDHYFRNLYRIVKIIDEANYLEEEQNSIKERYNYISILRASLSKYELIWLYYNGLGKIGSKKFKSLLEKYCILKNIRNELLSLSKENLCFNENQLEESIKKDRTIDTINLLPDEYQMKYNSAAIISRGFVSQTLEKEGFSGTDYEFLLSEDEEEGKYQITTFKKDIGDIEKEKKKLHKWNIREQ